MSKIIIGTSDGRNVGFDIEELLVSRLLVQANSGGGKSFLLRRMLEQAYGKVQSIVIDLAGGRPERRPGRRETPRAARLRGLRSLLAQAA